MWLDASLWVGLALVAALFSVRLGISVALTEIMAGAIGGNYLGLHMLPWVEYVAGFGAILLTFLAGAEVNPSDLRYKFKETVLIGFISFLFPFLGAFAFAYYVTGWTLNAALIAGIALSTTSVAVVYAVMVETGLNETELGKIILAACFITDLGTVVALGIFFANYDWWLAVFLLVSLIVIALTPFTTRWFIQKFGNQVSQMEVKFVFLLLFGLGGLALKANSEAVLPAYLLGLAVAKIFMQNKQVMVKMRAMAFAMLTPFYFLKAGLFISFSAVIAGFGLILVLLAVKMAAKFLGVWPLTKAFGFTSRDGMYTTLLMSTGLTFGTISALFGLSHKIIDQNQYTILATVVVSSAIVPTLIAQAFFRPKTEMASQ
ncbi:cation:proton antiporter [Desulfotruncus alcoholivorax]|uniref:cation:proton antiporter n=1 Tax=Desulfotruncus alcoholivorax TaxID=265477 RepID=UPI00054E3B62|nr:cation:proton antiporter [Desulfotruncus alcoholivorax]